MVTGKQRRAIVSKQTSRNATQLMNKMPVEGDFTVRLGGQNEANSNNSKFKERESSF